MSSLPHLKLPDGLQLRPSTTCATRSVSHVRPSPVMANTTLTHTSSSTGSKVSTQSVASKQVAVQPRIAPPAAVQPTTGQPAAVQLTRGQRTIAQPTTKQPTAVRSATQPVEVQPTTQPVAVQPTTQPVAIRPATQPVTVQPRTQPAGEQPTAKLEPAVIQPTARQATAVQPTAPHVGSYLLATHPTGTHLPWKKSVRRESEPVTKKRRLLEATEAAVGHEMTKAGRKQGDAEDILARVCSAVGIDSDLVESVVDDLPPHNHQSELLGNTHSFPGNLQYLRGIRPLHSGIPSPTHRLRRPEFRFHSSMHPAYRISPDGSFALAEVRHPYQQYHHRPREPAYMVPHRIAIRPGEPHHYRPFPHYLNRYQYVGPLPQVMNRPPVLRPGPPIGPSERYLPTPHSSPNLPQPSDLCHYPPRTLHQSPPGPPALQPDPRRGPPDVHHVPHTVPERKHLHPRHSDSEVPYGMPTPHRHSSSLPSSVPERPAARATSRPFAGSQAPLQPGLQDSTGQQKQRAGMHEMYIPSTSVNPYRPQSHPYPIITHPGRAQYHHLYPQGSESYSKQPCASRAEPVRDTVWQENVLSRAPVMPSRTSPDNRPRTSVQVRSSYVPEQLQRYDQTWGVKRPSNNSDRPPEAVQVRRTIEPPKPCVELIPIGPPRDARERKSAGEDSHVSVSVMQKRTAPATDPHQQSVNTNSSQHTQLPGRTFVNADHKALVAAFGQSAHMQAPAAYIPQTASLRHNHQDRISIFSTANPEVPSPTSQRSALRRPLSSDPSFDRNFSRVSSREEEASNSEVTKGQRYNRSNSEPSSTQSIAYNDKNKNSLRKTDPHCSTHESFAPIDDTKKQTTLSRTSSEGAEPQIEMHYRKISPGQVSTLDTNEEHRFTPDKERQMSTPDNDVTVEKIVYFTNRERDLQENVHPETRHHESHNAADQEKIERETLGPSSGQIHRLHSSRYVTHHRSASEPPLGSLSVANDDTVSPNKRPASLPSAGQQGLFNSVTMKCQDDLNVTFQQGSPFSENLSEVDSDEVFMERLKLVLNDLLSVPEATKLQQLSCSPGQQLASVVQRGGAHPSKDLSPRRRLREDFKTVVKLCLPEDLLKDWGWDSCTPDQILAQLIKVSHNGDNIVNGSVTSAPSSLLTRDDIVSSSVIATLSSPLTRDDSLEDDVFSPSPCSAPSPHIPGPYIHTTHVPEPPHDLVSQGPHICAVKPYADTSTTYTMHHHVPVSYVPTLCAIPPHAPCNVPACATGLHSHVLVSHPSDPYSTQVCKTGQEEHASPNQGKNSYPSPPDHAQHTAVKWPGSNSVVGPSECTPVKAKAPAT